MSVFFYDVCYESKLKSIALFNLFYQNNYSYIYDLQYAQGICNAVFDVNYNQVIPFVVSFDVGYNSVSMNTFSNLMLPQRNENPWA